MENSLRISRRLKWEHGGAQSREVLSEKLLGEMRPELLPAGDGMAWNVEENLRFLPVLRTRDSVRGDFLQALFMGELSQHHPMGSWNALEGVGMIEI